MIYDVIVKWRKKMKQIYVGLCIGMLAITLCACGKTKEPGGQDVSVEQEDLQQTVTEDTDESKTEDGLQADDESTSESMATGTPAQILKADFLTKMDDGQMTKTEDIATALVANPVIVFSPATMPVEPGFLNGFTEEIKGFSEGTMFGPAIGAIPFIGYVFHVDGDVHDFMSQLKEKADLRWNVCTQADEMVCEAKGDMVVFIMAPATFEE